MRRTPPQGSPAAPGMDARHAAHDVGSALAPAKTPLVAAQVTRGSRSGYDARSRALHDDDAHASTARAILHAGAPAEAALVCAPAQPVPPARVGSHLGVRVRP